LIRGPCPPQTRQVTLPQPGQKSLCHPALPVLLLRPCHSAMTIPHCRVVGIVNVAYCQ
jgi:hypothetical protein